MGRSFLLLIVLALGGCNGNTQEDSSTKVKEKDIKPTSSAPTQPRVPQQREMSVAEVRILAQEGGPEGVAQLQRLLSASEAVRMWAAFGLGVSCDGLENEKNHAALTGAVAAWATEEATVSAELLTVAGWALGACRGKKAEDLLRSWLGETQAEEDSALTLAAAQGLAALVDRQGNLSERTQTAVLNAAAQAKRGEVLLPLTRMGRLSEGVGAHVLDVAGTLIASDRKEGRRTAILSLGSAGPSAAEPLEQVFLGKNYLPNERAAAAEALGRLGEPGQTTLDTAVEQMLERGMPTRFDHQSWVPLMAALDLLKSPRRSQRVLKELRTVALPEGEQTEKVAHRRRLIWLRCRAADLIAEDQYASAALLQCSPEPSRISDLARLRVIDRGSLTGERKKAYLSLLESKDPVVKQAALRLMVNHPELESGGQLLVQALSSDVSGTQATAAQIIAAYPHRALDRTGDLKEHEELLQTLGTLLENEQAPIETRAAAIKAAGALQALSLKPLIETLCASQHRAIWHPARGALQLLGVAEPRCPPKAAQPAAPGDSDKTGVSTDSNSEVVLQIDSDVGPLVLRLNEEAAPASREHFLKLVDEGYYNGLTVHGARPGFAVQFGDQDGDGYDAESIPGLPNEVTPTPFSALSFGMSAFSEAAQNSQLFVVLSDAPQLTGSRVRLGQAEGPWHLLVVGDTLRSVKRDPKLKK